MNGVGANAVQGVLDSGVLRKEPDASLGCAVSAALTAAHESRCGGYVDNGAAAGTLHRGDGVLGAQEHAGRVDLHDLPPLLDVCIDNRRALVYRGVVDEYVETAVGLEREFDGAAPVVFAGDIEVYVGRLAAVLAYLRGCRLAFRVEDVREHDLRALIHE